MVKKYYICLLLSSVVSIIYLLVFSAISLSGILTDKRTLDILAYDVWPQKSRDDDRIEIQLKLGYVLAEYFRKHDKRKKHRNFIVLVPDMPPIHKPFVVGYTTNCPMTNCYLTNHSTRYRSRADAVVLANILLTANAMKKFLPKPAKQVVFCLNTIHPFCFIILRLAVDMKFCIHINIDIDKLLRRYP